ncbi:hypothetical protein CAOG_05246 [Capsaspora owczarzaki ATCC 30864]|uniref:c-Myc-binding protein n=1 Tax=Capsaspora owczarzaki (strain ATCC 30864) TaxID=595528 RepID=A0A0D2WRQ5_CAPO3|nr:hypothetical protein CAOG_05246 [Capsaspora owczarzaki ATCC 30864]KJE94625.1 hypothetical protein CAOG_005246 [Capsaspora owczarzaki ATCC 30864]|eukprot:XP_004346931.1 hypothetical protein CAOG_05246 [Capsaspora owczarzaki ATCC 30864]
MATQTSDARKEEFRKYLETNGVIDTLTQVLVGLYEEPNKPDNAMAFLKQSLSNVRSDGGAAAEPVDVDVLLKENQALKARVAELEKELASKSSE